MRKFVLISIAALLIVTGAAFTVDEAEAGRIVPRKQYYITWKWKNDKINPPTVCANHRKYSIAWRECRNQAKTLFKKRCKKRFGINKTRKRSYCYEAKHFRPVS